MNRVIFVFTFAIISFPAASQTDADRPGALFSDTSLLNVWKAAFNSNASDFSVTRYRKGFVFVSARETAPVHYFSTDPLTPLLDLFYFEQKDSN
ncbi:MAG TPA: hypothetical protein VI731_07090, partial [Bacteroidia bacterium]|nr:hypothetical protein [Bacteroidia bacterium]